MVVSSVDLVSNICLLIADKITDEPNEKGPTFNEEPSPDNDEFDNILVGDFYVFDKTMVYLRVLLGNRRRYNWIPDHHLSFKNFKIIQVTHLIVGESRTNFPKLKSSINLKKDIWQHTITDEIKLTVDDVTDLIGPTIVNQQS